MSVDTIVEGGLTHSDDDVVDLQRAVFGRRASDDVEEATLVVGELDAKAAIIATVERQLEPLELLLEHEGGDLLNDSSGHEVASVWVGGRVVVGCPASRWSRPLPP